ncbi:hypothetical protein CYMTET_45957, partial [Cymbomonas tetramitiformis]
GDVRVSFGTPSNRLAEKVLRNMAKMNGMENPGPDSSLAVQGRDTLEGKEDNSQSGPGTSDQHTPSMGMLDLFRGRNRVVTLSMCAVWFATSFVYYGLSLNAGNLSGDVYWNLALLSVIEIPGNYAGTVGMERIGRRTTCFLAFALAAVSCFATAATIHLGRGDVATAFVVTLSLAGKFYITAAFNTAYVYGAEVFPTVLRQSGLGIASSCGRIGGISAPAIVYLDRFGAGIPILVFGCVSALASGVAYLLPETRGKHLADTLEDAHEDTSVNMQD